MNIEKLRDMEPLFGSVYIETKISEGKNSKFYRAYRTDGVQKDYFGLKTVKFPSSDRELSRVIASGKYNNVDEYLDLLQQNVSRNMTVMRSLSYNKNIVSLHNFTIVRESSCFYVLMLVDLLTPLSDYLSFENISKEDTVRIGKDICRAMAAFREKGIVHHNITPENIYVDSFGNYKLGDFGLYDYESTTTDGSLYIAPELYHKNYLRDASSDIYALGILLYKLLNNNRLPFLPPYPAPISLSDREQSFAKCMRGEAFPTPANADFKLTNIISKATAYKADERYISPLAMLSQLETYTPYQQSAPVMPRANNFEINDNSGIRFDTYEYPAEEATEETYDDVYDNDYDDEESPKKRWYFLVFGLVIVLALVVALIVKSGSDGKDKTTTEHTSTTLAPPTQTTTETTTEETTEESTEESTTEETTTEETTTEETTTETTTAESTTEEITEPLEEPTLVSTNRKNGDKSDDGRTYMKISSYNLEEIPEDEFFDEVVLTIGDNLGENLMATKVYLYQMVGTSLIQKVSANMTAEISEDFGGNILCTVIVEDSDFYYEPENYQYYLCFEEGAIVSDSVITLPLQIRIETKY
ncbi:MAG: protein kinase [Clostridia bacterium]|nr:protein kinase [Clostridia bacterium]